MHDLNATMFAIIIVLMCSLQYIKQTSYVTLCKIAAYGKRQTANLKKFFCNKIKIMNREIFEQYDLL